jgi:hypothetical protein
MFTTDEFLHVIILALEIVTWTGLKLTNFDILNLVITDPYCICYKMDDVTRFFTSCLFMNHLSLGP